MIRIRGAGLLAELLSRCAPALSPSSSRKHIGYGDTPQSRFYLVSRLHTGSSGWVPDIKGHSLPPFDSAPVWSGGDNAFQVYLLHSCGSGRNEVCCDHTEYSSPEISHNPRTGTLQMCGGAKFASVLISEQLRAKSLVRLGRSAFEPAFTLRDKRDSQRLTALNHYPPALAGRRGCR
jgi:hypothetical protein